MIKYSIGVDISKTSFHACLSVIDNLQLVKVLRSGSFANSSNGFKDFTKWIESSHKDKSLPLIIVMEATGIYYENCALYLYKAGYHVSVMLPNKSKKYIAALNIKTKNDKVDAKALSRMGAEQSLQLWEPMNGYFYELRGLTRLYQTLQENLTSTRNQLEAAELGMYPSKQIIQSLKKIKRETEKQIVIIKEAIDVHLASNKDVLKKVNNIAAIKGLGVLTIAVVLAETNGFLLFENTPQLVSYAGYDVVENQSGIRVGKTKISKKGNCRLRRALYMPSLCVVRYKEKIFSDFFEKNCARHGVKMKSYVAIQKKLLTIIYTLWKKDEQFNPEYQHTTRGRESVFSSQAGFAKA
jgi:transposase